MNKFKAVLLIAGFLGVAYQCCAQGASGQITQGPGNTAGLLYASSFGQWSVPQGNTGPYSWAVPILCTVNAGGSVLSPVFKVNTPITIKDSNPANTEIVTPTAVNVGGFGCSITIAPVNLHNNYILTSATAGLQEAINYAHGLAYQVILTPDWSRIGGTTGMITSALGNSNVSILDERTAIFQSYTWNGSAYVVTAGIGSVTGQAVGVLPLPCSAGSICAQSPIDYGVTTAAVVTSSKPFAAPSVTASAILQAGNSVVLNSSSIVSTPPTAGGPITNNISGNFSFVDRTPGWNVGNEPQGPGGWQVSKRFLQNFQSMSSGIKEGTQSSFDCYAPGDCVEQYTYAGSSGGHNDASGEGVKSYASQTFEHPTAYSGTCATGCTAGSTLIKLTSAINSNCNLGLAGGNGNSNNGCPGTGRYFRDVTAGDTSCTYTAIASGLGGASALTVSGCSITPSTAWGTLTSNCGPAAQITVPPYTASQSCTVSVTSGTFNTSGILCFASQHHECAIPTAVSGSGTVTVTIPIGYTHASGSYVYQGGMTGDGVDFVAYDQSPQGYTLIYLFDVFGATDSSTLQVGYFIPTGVASLPNLLTLNYQTFNVTSLSNSGATVSGTYAGTGTLSSPPNYAGGTFTFAASGDAALNVPCAGWTWTTATAFTCTIAGLSGSHTAATATASLSGNTANIWPMAAALDVRNPVTATIDGTMLLEPNTMNIGTSDTLEEPNSVSMQISSSTDALYVSNPFTFPSAQKYVSCQGAGCSGGATSTTSTSIQRYVNSNTDSIYSGFGGNLTPPNGINFSGDIDVGLNFDHFPQNSQALIFAHGPPSTWVNNNLFKFSILRSDGSNSGSAHVDIVPFTNELDITASGPLVLTGSSIPVHGKLLTTASTTGTAGVNIPAGTAPTSPVNGDVWTTSAGIYVQINGSTVGPLVPSQGSVASGTTGQIAYYASNGTAVSGTNAIPAGALVGTTDAQTLTNKIYATVNITTGASSTITGTNTLNYNQEATAATAVTYTLPAPTAGQQHCVKNSNNGSAADTGVLEILVANTGTQSLILNGAKSTAAGNITSSGAAGDSACVVGISTTQWEVYVSVGTWTLH
jgi:hypothetical protein